MLLLLLYFYTAQIADDLIQLTDNPQKASNYSSTQLTLEPKPELNIRSCSPKVLPSSQIRVETNTQNWCLLSFHPVGLFLSSTFWSATVHSCYSNKMHAKQNALSHVLPLHNQHTLHYQILPVNLCNAKGHQIIVLKQIFYFKWISCFKASLNVNVNVIRQIT